LRKRSQDGFCRLCHDPAMSNASEPDFLAYIEAHRDEPMTVAELAARAGEARLRLRLREPGRVTG
jgi:hypothetical protein